MPLLWYMLDLDTLTRLHNYNWRTHRRRLTKPSTEPPSVTVTTEIEKPEEIDRIIRKPPKHWRLDL